MRKIFPVFVSILALLTGILFSGVFSGTNALLAAPIPSPDDSVAIQGPDMAGNWLLVINHNGYIQLHDMNISGQDENGNLSGTGGYPHAETYAITWKLTDSKIGKNGVNLVIYYDNSDYVAKLSGQFQPNGIIVGTWKDNRGLEGNWSAAPVTPSAGSQR